ncbi:MAG: hypothetical protein M3P01_01605 [Actinomycetota bacterium]|nr:hypothetical protein [Actinomycetota bacterium]
MAIVTAAAALLSGCSRGTVTEGPPPVTGPPRVQIAAIRERAHWFDANDPSRVAGSQQELVASSYLLARLEQAGYLVDLDPVPVGNLLHSTNVIALPPSGKAATVVVVDYDTSASAPSDGAAIGTFLELARSLRALHPHHSVEFAALGAQQVAVNGGQVGARSLIELLRPQSPQPQIIRIGQVTEHRPEVSVAGAAAAAIRTAALRTGVALGARGPVPDDVFTRAGLGETTVDGGLAVGSVLLAYLGATQG